MTHAPGVSVPLAVLNEVARTADTAARAVDAVWGPDWSRGITVVVGDREALDLAGGASLAPGALPAVAVTRPSLSGRGAPDEIVVDQAVWGTLSATGRRVVLTHELVHVATGSVATSVPRWLEEGFADYVGWLGNGVPVAVAAREALVRTTSRGAPSSLPGSADLDLSSETAGAAYGEAYVAVRWLAQTYGQDALVAVYRRTQLLLAGSDGTSEGSSDEALDAALRAVTGHGVADLELSWRAELTRLAAATA